MLVESNNPDYVANLIEYFKADQDVCDFIMMWGIEEWKHYYALRDYLTKVQRRAGSAVSGAAGTRTTRASRRSVDPCDRALGDDVDAVREASTENWGIPAHYMPAQVVANTTRAGVHHGGLLPHTTRAHEGADAREARDAAGEGRDASRDVLRAEDRRTASRRIRS